LITGAVVWREGAKGWKWLTVESEAFIPNPEFYGNYPWKRFYADKGDGYPYFYDLNDEIFVKI